LAKFQQCLLLVHLGGSLSTLGNPALNRQSCFVDDPLLPLNFRFQFRDIEYRQQVLLLHLFANIVKHGAEVPFDTGGDLDLLVPFDREGNADPSLDQLLFGCYQQELFLGFAILFPGVCNRGACFLTAWGCEQAGQ
jgi:hypothetical protein